MAIVFESLDPAGWTPEQQQAVYGELQALLGITPAIPYPSMTDIELSEALSAVANEMRVRPSAVVTGIDSIAFGNDSIFVPQTP